MQSAGGDRAWPGLDLFAAPDDLDHLAHHRDGDLPWRLAGQSQSDGRLQAFKIGVRRAQRPQAVQPFGQAAAAAEHAHIARLRRQGGDHGRVVQLRVVGGDGDAGPGIQADLRQGLAGRNAEVGDAGDGRRRGGALGAHEGGLEADLRAHGGDGQGGRVRAYDDQLLVRIEAAEQGEGPIMPGACPALRRQGVGLAQRRRQMVRGLPGAQTGALHAVAQPERRTALPAQGDEPSRGGIVRSQPFQQDLDASAAGQADVGGTAAAIDQAAGRPVSHHSVGVQRDIGFHAPAGEVADDDVGAEQHLGPDAARGSALGGEQGGQNRRLPGLLEGGEARADIVLQPEGRPVDVGQVHRRGPGQGAAGAGTVFR